MEQARLSLISYGPHKEKFQRAKLQPGSDIPLHIPLSSTKVHLGTVPSPTLMSVTLQQVDAAVSRTHCVIERTLGEGKPAWHLTDMSTNGTYLNEERCEFGKTYLLASLDEVVLGDPQVSALRYQFSVGTELGKRQREGRTTPVVVEAKRTAPLEARPDPSLDELGSLRSMDKVLRRALEPKPNDSLCAYCQRIAISPLDLPCKHTVCFLCYDHRNFQTHKAACEVCSEPLDAYKLPASSPNLQERLKDSASPSVLALLRPLEEAIAEREMHILRVLRLRETGYQKAVRESKEPLDSPFLSAEYLELFSRKMRAVSPGHKQALLRAQGLSEGAIERADERQLSLMLARLKVDNRGETLEEKRAALMRFLEMPR